MPQFDYVIIGSGLGGLLCAYTLTKEGNSVCVLEKNRQIGGNLQIFVRDKAIFDTGIHYIGGLDEGQNLNQYFRYFGLMEKLKLKKLDEESFDVVSFDKDEKEYSYAMGYEKFSEKLIEQFPLEKDAIHNYCAKLKEISNFSPLYNLRYSEQSFFNTEYLSVNAKQYIESITSNTLLQNVLAGTNPLYAGIGEKTPLYVHGLIINSYIESAYKCIGGGAQIATILTKSIKEMGGEIRNYSEVTKFCFKGDEIESVELTNGERVEGKRFISNIHPSNTLDMVESGKIRKAYSTRIHSLENTSSVFILNIVLKPKTLKYRNSNIYHYKNEDVWNTLNYNEDNWPLGYALFFPVSRQDEEYAESLTIMAYMKYEDVAPWEFSFHTIPHHRTNRGEGYEEFKIRKAEKLIDELEKRIPGLRGKIKSYNTSTPLTYRDYIGTKDGSMYGVMKDYNDPIKTFIPTRTKVPNLFFTGQNISLHGVLGVTISSVTTCSEFFGMEYLIDKIRKA
ncbi:MAG: NAD(P)/FAD-dependent oxidoreductase [Sporocytophaga sp.]|uniref:phytoene desaturase family protein n=1 Tax=Sporocytophaga sp. TaxID=2231183 RepID=UPI001B05AC01|nr:NAD(P)/FAD-dependent oxidoreductase [Sporocytophaga sp.]MBO9700297.1 NAD(P)/FAD-dependent oxidoreductase [Sporocytophaga sp.]